jgi:hypothetical protein
MRQLPVYLLRVVPVGTPVVSAEGKLRPRTTNASEGVDVGVGVGVADVGVGVGVADVGVGVGAADVGVGVGVADGLDPHAPSTAPTTNRSPARATYRRRPRASLEPDIKGHFLFPRIPGADTVVYLAEMGQGA